MLAAATSALAAATSALAADSSGQLLTESCRSCHVPGRGTSAIPEIHGMKPADIAARLRMFKLDLSSGTVMPRIARGFSESEIDALAAALVESKP